MFSVHRNSVDGFEKIVLRDHLLNTSAEILPGCSAMLHAFRVQKDGRDFNVIDSYTSQADFENNLTEAGFKGCKLSPFVCRIKDASYTFGNKKYTLQKFLAGKDALHGELFDKSFEVTAVSADEEKACVTMKYRYDREDQGYPFLYDCIVTWQLKSDNRLSVITECINRDAGLIPMQDGWHPYFALGEDIDELQLEFQSMELIAFENLIPNGEKKEYDRYNSLKKIGDTKFDNCFTLNLETCQPMCVLRSKSHGIQIEIHPEESYPYLQLYTPAHRKSIAIENLSGAPDGFNNGMGLKTLEPGQSAKFEVLYKVVILKDDHE